MTVCVLFFSAQSLHAQVDTGTITGTISDSSSAVVGGAKVTLTNEGTSAALSTTADSGGGYTFTPVRIGYLLNYGYLSGVSNYDPEKYQWSMLVRP